MFRPIRRPVLSRPGEATVVGRAAQVLSMQTKPFTQFGTGTCKPAPAATHEWLSGGQFALLLGILVFVAFPQVLLGWESFVFRDFGLFGYPLAHFQRECFWQGHLPFWNPYSSCGVPFLAQWNTMSLYPVALIYLILPLSWSLSFFCLLHLFFAGLGMYGLAYRWTEDRLGASVAGLIFTFNGLSLNSLMWPSQMATFAWVPWVVLAVEKGWQEGGGKVIWAGLAGATQMLCGGPETILFTWWMIAGLWVVSLKAKACALPTDGSTPQHHLIVHYRFNTGLRLGTIVLLALGLSAAQLFPFLDLVRHSQRGHNFEDPRWPLPLRGWANFLVPMAFGSPGEAGVWFEHDQFWTSSFYLGIGTVLFGVLAMWRKRERRVWFLIGANIGAFILALGSQTVIYNWLRVLLPPLKGMTFPVKFIIIIAFAAPLLAGMGVARVKGRESSSADPGRPSRHCRGVTVIWTAALMILLITFILVWARVWPLPKDNFPATLRNGITRIIFLMLIAGVFLLLRRSSSQRRNRALSLALLLLMWLDVWTHEPQQNPTAPAAVYQPGLVRNELAMQPQPQLGQTRVMVSPWANQLFEQQHLRVKEAKDSYLAARLGYYCNCNLLDAVPKVNGFFALYPYECDQMTQLLYLSTNKSFPRLQDFLCVSHVTAPGEFTVWESRSTALPPITAGQAPVFLDNTNTLRRMIRSDFEPGKTVFLPPEAKPFVLATEQADARVLTYRFSREEVEAEVEANRPSLVTIAQTYYPCWRAYVDQRPASLMRANFAFQAVAVPAGKHSVRLAYQERGFRLGAIISILTALGCVVGSLALRRSPLGKRGSSNLGSLAAQNRDSEATARNGSRERIHEPGRQDPES